jgi:restriction system protein
VATFDRGKLPSYRDLILPTLEAVASLGGSAQAAEITDALVDRLSISPEQLAVTYDSRPKSVIVDRIEWARYYARLGGGLDSPRRGLFVLSSLGKQILALPEGEAQARVAQLDREVRATVRREREAVAAPSSELVEKDGPEPRVPLGLSEEEDDDVWKDHLLARLHSLSPTGFEEFAMYLLRTFGLELTRVGGVGDEGIDGIGLAPISAVLSSRVAVQAKRYDPTSTVGRETVGLFQRDASAAGAERAVLVTLAHFSPAARKAATATTPTVDLIDGDKLCELVRQQQIGLKTVLHVDGTWFDRFDA